MRKQDKGLYSKVYKNISSCICNKIVLFLSVILFLTVRNLNSRVVYTLIVMLFPVTHKLTCAHVFSCPGVCYRYCGLFKSSHLAMMMSQGHVIFIIISIGNSNITVSYTLYFILMSFLATHNTILCYILSCRDAYDRNPVV